MEGELYYATEMFLSENSFQSTEEKALERAKDMFWMDEDYIVVFEVKKMYKVNKELEQVNVNEAMQALKDKKMKNRGIV